jgi:putative protease
MANWDTPKSTGEYIGQVTEAQGNTLRVQLDKGIALHNGDGLTIGSEGFSVNGIEGNIVKINKAIDLPNNVMTLYRNYDIEFSKSLHSERRIPVDIVFRETEDGFELTYQNADGRCQRRFAYPHEPAKNAEKAIETIRTQLSKLGDTPYVAHDIRMESQPYFIPIGVLNEWRRNTLESEGATDKGQKTEMNVPVQAGLSSGLYSSSERGERSLMTCKYCILYESGHCRKTAPYPQDKEPRYLRLRTGKVLRLTFDCKNCQMSVDEL